jgi:MFS family permease
MQGPGMGGGPVVLNPPGGWRRTFSSLQLRDFRVYWIGMLFSFIGMQMGMIARQWLVYDLTGSTTALGLVGAVSGVPMLLLSIPGGVIADRLPKRNVLIAVQSVTGILGFAIGFLIVTGLIEVWHVIVVSLIAGAAMTFNMPARQAMVAELVGPERLMNAIALNSAGMNLTRIVAPTVAGVLVAAIGLAGTYFTYAASYIIVVIFLLMLPATNAGYERWQRSTPWAEAIEGLRYLRQNRLVLSLMVLATVPAIFAMPYMMLLPVYARDIHQVGSTGYGIMSSATGIGALLGSLVVASLGEFQGKGKLLLAGAVGFGFMVSLFALAPYLSIWTNEAGTYGLGLVPMSVVFLLSLGLLALLGIASNSYMAMNNTLVMLAIPEELRGRVMGVYMMTWGFMPLGVLPIGILGDLIGVPLVLAAGGLSMVATSIFIWLAVPELRELDKRAAAQPVETYGWRRGH